jgi:hypothetical protein
LRHTWLGPLTFQAGSGHSKQSLVAFKNVVIALVNKILYDDVELAAEGQGLVEQGVPSVKHY